MAEVRWAETALADLTLQRDYLDQQSPNAARRFVEQCFESAGMLAHYHDRVERFPKPGARTFAS